MINTNYTRKELYEKSGIYEIINLKNNKKLIGLGINLYNRLKQHSNQLLNNKHHNKHFQNSYNKYGHDAFEFKIILFCEKKSLNTSEIYYINFYKTTDSMYGYNKYSGGDSYDKSEEHKRKIGIGNKGKIISESTKTKLREYNLGKKHTEESKQKMSKSRIGHIVSKEVREKISKSQSGEKGYWFGKESLQRKSIIQLDKKEDFIREWDCINDAEKELQIKGISAVCKGKRKSAGGFKWQYKI